MARRPKPFAVGSTVRARAIRGPHSDGSGRWYWQATAKVGTAGKYPTVWTGWALRSEAESAVLAVAASQTFQAPEHSGPSDVRTVRDVLEVWVWHITNVGGRRGPLSKDSIRLYRAAACHLAADIGDVSVGRLHRSIVEDYRDRRLRAGLASYTVSNEVRILGVAYRWWADRAPLQLPPFPAVRVKTSPIGNRHTPSRSESLAVIDQLTGWGRIVAILLFATGARPSEVRDLRWAAVDLVRQELHLDGKTGRRVVPVSADVVAELRKWSGESPDPSAPVCGVSPKTFQSTFGSRVLVNACKGAGVPVFTPYGLRRAAVDAMARAGVDIATAASITGHSPEVMLKHYRTVSGEDRRTAMITAGLGVLRDDNVIQLHRRGPGLTG